MMEQLQSYGAATFEQRAYFKTEINSTFKSFGPLQLRTSYKSKTYETIKTKEHPNEPAAKGYVGENVKKGRSD